MKGINEIIVCPTEVMTMLSEALNSRFDAFNQVEVTMFEENDDHSMSIKFRPREEKAKPVVRRKPY